MARRVFAKGPFLAIRLDACLLAWGWIRAKGVMSWRLDAISVPTSYQYLILTYHIIVGDGVLTLSKVDDYAELASASASLIDRGVELISKPPVEFASI